VSTADGADAPKVNDGAAMTAGDPPGVELLEGVAAQNDAVDLAALDIELRESPDDDARTGIAFAPRVLRAAALAVDLDPLLHARMRRTLKAHRVALSPWDRAVESRRRDLRDEAERVEAARVAAAEAKARELSHAAESAQENAAQEQLAARRRAVGKELAPFVDAFTAAGGVMFSTAPGETWATIEKEQPDGSPGRAVRRHLVDAAGRIVAVIHETAEPEAPPSTWFRVGFASARGAPFTVDVRAEEFDALGWVTPLTGGRVVLSPGRDTRDLARIAIASTRRTAPETHRRAFLGWVREGNRWVKLHAGGAIGREGAVAGVEVRAPGKLARYTLPAPPTGAARSDALDVLRELVSLEPAGTVLPVVAFVVRSMLGPGAGVCHLHGRANTGKSHLAALALCLAGDFDGPRALPGEWEKDTPNHTAKALSLAGDVPWGMDDWRPAWDPAGARFHDVARAVFNLAGRGALNRARGFNDTSPPRGSVLSTGEALPTGGSWSGLSRVLAVELAERVTLPGGLYVPAPDDDEDSGRAFVVRAPEQLARAGAVLAQWLAPRMDSWRDPEALGSRKRLVTAERAALARWDLRETERAVDVLGPVALGAAVLYDFLAETRAMKPAALKSLDRRLRGALAALATERRAVLDAASPGRAFIETLRDLLLEGRCHAAQVIAGRIVDTPPSPMERSLGWQRRNGSWEARGSCVAHLDARYPGKLAVAAGPAHAVVSDALRRAGRVPDIASPDQLGRELAAAQLLSDRETGKRAAVRTRVSGSDAPRYVIALDAFGLDAGDAPDITTDE